MFSFWLCPEVISNLLKGYKKKTLGVGWERDGAPATQQMGRGGGCWCIKPGDYPVLSLPHVLDLGPQVGTGPSSWEQSRHRAGRPVPCHPSYVTYGTFPYSHCNSVILPSALGFHCKSP